MAATSFVECPRCQAGMASSDARCPACGLPRHGVPQAPDGSSAAESISKSGNGHRPLVDNPYAVLAAVFLAMAALGIPLIWMCRAWSPLTKAMLTVVTLAYTALLFWLLYVVLLWSWGRISGTL